MLSGFGVVRLQGFSVVRFQGFMVVGSDPDPLNLEPQP